MFCRQNKEWSTMGVKGLIYYLTQTLYPPLSLRDTKHFAMTRNYFIVLQISQWKNEEITTVRNLNIQLSKWSVKMNPRIMFLKIDHRWMTNLVEVQLQQYWIIIIISVVFQRSFGSLTTVCRAFYYYTETADICAIFLTVKFRCNNIWVCDNEKRDNFRLELLDLVVVVVIMFHRFSIAIPLLFDTSYPISMDFTLCQRLSVASYFAFLEMDSNWRRYHFSYGLLISRLATISIHELKYVPGSCRTYFSGIIQNLRAQYL